MVRKEGKQGQTNRERRERECESESESESEREREREGDVTKRYVCASMCLHILSIRPCGRLGGTDLGNEHGI